MAKTVKIDPSIHLLLMNAKVILLNSGINITIEQIVETLVKDHLDEFISKSEDAAENMED